MAGQYTPQIIEGSSLRGESFIKPAAIKVPAQAVATLVEGATTAYGIHAKNVAAKEISAEQESFLNDFSNLQQKNAAAEGMLANTGDETVYKNFKSQYETLTAAANSGRLNPAESLARIEDAKRRAIARAPMFAQQIKSLSGAKGVEFDAVTSQMIKERNDLRDATQEAGRDPNNPAHLEMTLREKSLKAEAEFIKNNRDVYGYKRGKVARDLLGIQINTVVDQIKNGLMAHGGVENAPQKVRSEHAEYLLSFMGGNEHRALAELFDKNIGPDGTPVVSYDDLTKDDKEALALQMRSSAEGMYKVIMGGIPKQIADDMLSLAGSEIMLDYKDKNKEGFYVWTMGSKAPADSAAGRAIGEDAARLLLKHILSRRNGQDSTQALKDQGYTDPQIAYVKGARAETKTQANEFFKDTPTDQQDPKFRREYFNVLADEVKRSTDNVRGYTTKEHITNLDAMSDKNTLDALKNSDPETYKKFVDNSGEYLKEYSSKHLGNDIYNQLVKDVTVSEFSPPIVAYTSSAMTGLGPTVRDSKPLSQIATAVISPTGSIMFTLKPEYADNFNAINAVKAMNNTYRSPISKVATAATVVTDGALKPNEITARLFGTVLGKAGIEVTVDKSWAAEE